MVARCIHDSSSRQWSQSCLGTFRLSISLVEPHFNSQILPSHKFIQGECGSICFLWHPAPRSFQANSSRFCCLDPSMIISGGTPSCLNRRSRANGASLFLVIGMVRDHPQDVANTCTNLWPRWDTVPASNVSVNTECGNCCISTYGHWLGISSLLRDWSHVTCLTPLWVVTRTVFLALSGGMFHHLASIAAVARPGLSFRLLNSQS